MYAVNQLKIYLYIFLKWNWYIFFEWYTFTKDYRQFTLYLHNILALSTTGSVNVVIVRIK